MTFMETTYYEESFEGISLTEERVAGKTFEECSFSASSFIGCRFEKCTFLNCCFDDCIISALVPADCRFRDVVFKSSKVMGIDWTRTRERRALVFENCQVNYSSFRLLSLPGLKMIGCEARETDFTGADLSRGDFRDCNFELARFFQSNLSYADFRNARNYAIDIRTCTIKQARFSLPEALALLAGLDIILE